MLRRQQLQELEAQAQLVSAQAAGRATLRAWLQVTLPVAFLGMLGTCISASCCVHATYLSPRDGLNKMKVLLSLPSPFNQILRLFTNASAVQRVELRKRHQAVMLAIITSVLRRQLSTAWSAWRSYTLRKRQQQQDLQEVGAA